MQLHLQLVRGGRTVCFLLVGVLLASAATAQRRNRLPQIGGDPTLRTVMTRHFAIQTNTAGPYARILGERLDSYYDQLARLLPELLSEDVSVTRIKANVRLYERQEEYQRHARRNAPQQMLWEGYLDH